MSDSPRTDAAICNRVHTPNVFGFKEHDRVEEFVRADFARTLERENAELAEALQYADLQLREYGQFDPKLRALLAKRGKGAT